MKERGKAVESAFNNIDMDYYSSSSDLPCKKHPSSSSVGICAYCLKDRLIKLVCSDCGEQRLSSCSCSEISSNRNSCTVEVGSVGRVSFLIENERSEVVSQSHSKAKVVAAQEKAEEVVVLKRSSSSCVEIKRSGFWRIGRLFRKKKEKGCVERSSVNGGCDEKSDLWLVDYMGVSRSRSLCSFRGTSGLFGSEDGGEHLVVSGARSSISAARSSGVNAGLILDSGRRSGFSEAEPRKSGFDGQLETRKSGFDGQLETEKGTSLKKGGGSVLELDAGFNRRVFSLKESDFNGMDESGFIDLKLDYSSETKPEFCAVKMGVAADPDVAAGSMRGSGECGGGPLGNIMGDGSLSHGSSCRITVNERGMSRGRKSLKGWRWIFRHNPSWGSSTRKKDEDFMFKT
ncbi:putative lysozyme-like protein [Fagus crenata]